jgi:hypothetical protein
MKTIHAQSEISCHAHEWTKALGKKLLPSQPGCSAAQLSKPRPPRLAVPFLASLLAVILSVHTMAWAGVNDAPMINNPGSQTTNEDSTYSLNGRFTVTETAPASNLLRATVSIVTGGANLALTNGIVTAPSIVVDGQIADVNLFLNSLSIIPAANWNGAGSFRIRITSDRTNQTVSNTVTIDVPLTVSAVNDAPVASGSATLTAVDEDDAAPAGAEVSGLFSSSFSDSADNVSGGSSANTLAGVAVVGYTVNAAQGQWQYYNGSSWSNVGSRSAASALLVAGSGKLRFLPAANWFGTPSTLSLRLVDNSGGAVTSGTVVNASSAGGTTVYSLATVSLSTSVTAVNDAPATSDITLSATKNAISTFSLSSTEVDSGTSTTIDALVTSYKITSLPSHGTIKTSSNGSISVNDVLTVAQATNMKYTPTTNYVGSDTFAFLAVDAAGAESTASNVNITVAPFNEPPSTSMPSAVTVAEDSTGNVLGSPSIADSDAGSATVKVTLSVLHGSVTLSGLTGLTDAASGGAALTADTFASQTFYGTMSAINTALTGLKYAPTANYYGSDTLTLVVDDLGNATPPAKTATGTQTITVTNVPDAPVTGAATLAAINEDPVAVTGAAISALLTGYTDADSNSLAGIAVSSNDANSSTEGVWQYSLNNGVSWNAVGTVSTASALLLPTSARLRFVPVANFYGSPAGLAIHAVDNSAGRTFTSALSRQTLNVSSAGADYDSTGTTLGTTVNGVNDVFQIVNDQDYVVSEGGTVVLSSSVLLITDVEASASQIVYTILSSGTVLSEGLLQKDTSGSGTWSNLAATNTFTQADINSGRIRYVHGGGEPAVAQSVAYTVTDQVAGAGGTTATRSLDIPVSPVNDAPLVYLPGDVVPGTPPVTLVGTVEVGTTLIFSTSNITVVDPDNTAEQLVFRIESLPSNGSLQLNGNDLGVNSTFNFAEIKTNASFSYTPSAGAGTDSFTVSLRDGAGGVLGAAGGSPSTPLQVNLQIIPRNFSPVIVSETYSMLELEQDVDLQLDVSDTEDTNDANLTIEVVELPATGEAVLKFNGTAINSTGFTFNGSQVNLLKITHTSSDRVNPPDVSFKLKITDRGNPVGTNAKSTTSTFNLEVREVDDDPTLTVSNFTLTAQGDTYTINKEPAGTPDLILDGNDVDSADSKLLYRVTRIPASGFLLLNNKPLGVGGTFTQADVDTGKLKYQHNGYGSTSDYFKVTLRDQGFNIRYNRPGGVYANTVTTTLLEKTVNITIPAGGGSPGGGTTGTVGDGGVAVGAYGDILYTNKNITLTTPKADLLANDGGWLPLDITAVTMTGGNGTVSLVGSDVVFVPTRGFYGITSFNYTIVDGGGRTSTGSVTVYVFYVDYPPTIPTNTGGTPKEGREFALTQAMLEAEDEEQAPDELLYVLDALPDNGVLYLDATPLNSVADAQILETDDSFTQDDINNGRVKFVHDGGEKFSSSFTFQVEDGSNPAVPDGSVETFTFNTTPVNDSPDVLTVGFSTYEGLSQVLATSNLSATDADGVSSDKSTGYAASNTLTYSLKSTGLPVNGVMQKDVSGTWTNLVANDTFTQADVDAGRLRYLHNGTETKTDLVTITVDDGMSATPVWSAAGTNQAWSAIASSAQGNLLVAAVSGGLYSSVDAGATWGAFAGSLPAVSWTGVALNEDGSTLLAVATGEPIRLSEDGGTTWTTKDSARSWTAVAMSESGGIMAAAVDGGQIYVSTDAGDTWSATGTSQSWNSLSVSSNGFKMVASAANGSIYVTDNAGVEWTEAVTAGQRDWKSVAIAGDGSRLVAVANNEQVFVSENMGISWTPEGRERAWRHVSISEDGMTVLATASDNLYLSKDGGETWAAQDSTRNWGLTAQSANADTLVATVTSGQIYRGPPEQGASVVEASIRIKVIPVNDDPRFTVNVGLTVDEGGTGLIPGTVGTGAPAVLLLGADEDNTDTQVQFRLVTAPAHGSLKLDGVVLGVGSRITLAELKANKLSYTHDGSETTSDSFDAKISDSGGGAEEQQTFAITITPENDAPVNVVPAGLTVVEQTATTITGLSVQDPDSVDAVTTLVDSNFGPLRVTLSATAGVLNLPPALVVSGNGTSTVVIQGKIGALNTALASATYTSGVVSGVSSSDTITMVVDDLGNSGSGGAKSDTDTLAVTIEGMNEGPVLAVPGAQTLNEDGSLVFSTANSTSLSFTDGDLGSASASFSVSVTRGSLTLAATTGLTGVSGNGTGTITFSGSRTNILAALNGLTYAPNANYFGSDTLTVVVNDNGNSGTYNTPQSDTETVAITVNPVNDLPTVTNLSTSVAEDGTATFSLSSSDVDSGTSSTTDARVTHYYIKIYADNSPTTAGLLGTIKTSDNQTLTAAGSVAPASYLGLGAGEHVITVAQATSMTYAPPADYNSALAVTGTDWRSKFEFRAIDIVSTGLSTASLSTATATETITVNAVNDAPSLAGTSDKVYFTEGVGPQVVGTAVVLDADGDTTLADMELVTQGVDNFNGTTLTVRRSVAAVSVDRFSVSNVGSVTVSGTTVSFSGTAVGSITNNSSTGTLVVTFNGSATLAAVQGVMRSVSYNNIDDDLTGDIGVQMFFNDDNVASAQGSGGALSSTALAFTVNVTNTNDAPTLTGGASISVNEDNTSPSGATVNSLLASRFADLDPSGAGAQFVGIAITGDASNAATQGKWQYSSNGTDWADVSSTAVSTTSALLLEKTAQLRFVPVADYNGRFNQGNISPGSLTAVAIDGSGSRTWSTHAARSTADTVTGWTGSSDIGAASSAAIAVSVTQVNDAPVISDLADDSLFTEAFGINVAGPSIVLDDKTGLRQPATLSDVELTVRKETTFNGSKLVVRAGTFAQGDTALDPKDYFLPQTAGGIAIVGSLTEVGPGVEVFDNGSVIQYGGGVVGTITQNSVGTGKLIITFNSSANKASLDELLQNMAYSNGDPKLASGTKPITFIFHDGNGNVGNSQGSGGELSGHATVSMDILARNDAPLFSQGAMLTADEGATSPARSFSTLLGSYYSDPDDISPNPLAAVALSGFDNAGKGHWQVSLNGTTWKNLADVGHDVGDGGISPSNALLLATSAQVRFVPFDEANTDAGGVKPSITVHAVETAVPAGSALMRSPLPTGLAYDGSNNLIGSVTLTTDITLPVTYDMHVDPLDATAVQERQDSLFSVDGVLVQVTLNPLNDNPVIAGAGLPATWDPRERSRAWASIASSADGMKIISAVATNGYIYTSSDRGTTWTEQTASGSRNWRAVSTSADGAYLAAVADNDRIYVSADSGATWSATATVKNWTAITSSADGRYLAAVADNDFIYVSTDSGASWQARESSRDWVSVTSSEDGSVLAAADSGGKIYVSTNRGSTWTARASNSAWTSVAVNGSGTLIVATMTGGQIQVSTDAGATWTAVETSRNWTSAAISRDGRRMFAVADNEQIYHSFDSGVTWQASETSHPWTDIACSADGSRIIAAASIGFIYRTALERPAAFSGVLVKKSPADGGGTSYKKLLTSFTLGDLDTATTSDLSSEVFGAGTVEIAFVTFDADDEFSIEDAGSGTGQIGITGSTVKYEGQSFGTFAGGLGSSLVVTLDPEATYAQVEALVRALRYRSTSMTPPMGSRIYTLTISDGDNTDADGDTAGGPASLATTISAKGSLVIAEQFIKFGPPGADPTLGMLDSSIIPNTTTTPVLYSNVCENRFDVQLSTRNVAGNGFVTIGGEAGWLINGSDNGSTGTVTFRFYEPGTSTLKPLDFIFFSIEDAEQGEQFVDFCYWNAAGVQVYPSVTDASIFSYSDTPITGAGVVENGAPLVGKLQTGKWMRVDLRGTPITGIQFGYRKRFSAAGSVVVTHLGGYPVGSTPNALDFGGNFTPMIIKANGQGLGTLPDYTVQATMDPLVTGVITQTPEPGTSLALGAHRVALNLEASDGQTAYLGFDVTVIASQPPRLTVTSPAAAAVSSKAPYRVRGTITDNEGAGISWVKVALNGGAPVTATVGAPNASGVSEWSLDVTPVAGSNTVVVTAEDSNGVSGNTVSRTFTFTRRYGLEVARTAPAGIDLDTAGTVTLTALSSTTLTPTTANANPRTSEVTPGAAVKLTAAPKTGYIISHWTGAPAGATVSGAVMSFTMPSADVSGVTAHFVSRNPFLAPTGQGNVFYGLIQPVNAADRSNATTGFLTGTLTGTTGAFSGRVLVAGLSQSFSATFFGDGTSLFTVGTTKLTTLSFSGYSLTLGYSGGAVQAVLQKSGVTSTGTARRLIHTTANKVRTALLNTGATSGLYNVAVTTKVQTPAAALDTYPQGDGVGTVTLSNVGLVTFAGTLADGTTYTASSGLVSGDESPVFAQLVTPGAASTQKGGSLGGVLAFDETEANSDVTATDLVWIRPAVTELSGTTVNARATQLYTNGWPSGIVVDAVGALYDKSVKLQVSLDLATVAAGVKNAVLEFTEGKLTGTVSQDAIRIVDNVVGKVPATNPAFTLTVTPMTGMFSGTFTPNWTSAATAKPAFRGVILQKGTSKGGYGYFISNRTSDTDPASGRVTLGKP